MTNCPACGQPLASDTELLFDAQTGQVYHDGAVAYLTPMEALIYNVLWARRPQLVSRNTILDEVYASVAPDSNGVTVMVSRINKKLHPIGLRIDNVWGRGYKIVVAKKEN